MAEPAELLFTPAPNSDWRAPTKGEHACQSCHAAAPFGLANAWFCRRCVPHGFFPKDRVTPSPAQKEADQ